MADLEVKQVNTLPKNSVVLTDYLLAIGSTEEYQAKVQDVVLAGMATIDETKSYLGLQGVNRIWI